MPPPSPPPAALLQPETRLSTAPNAPLAALPSPPPPPYTANAKADLEAARATAIDTLVATRAGEQGTVHSFILLSPGLALHVSEAEFIQACTEADRTAWLDSYWAWYFPTRGLSTYPPYTLLWPTNRWKTCR